MGGRAADRAQRADSACSRLGPVGLWPRRRWTSGADTAGLPGAGDFAEFVALSSELPQSQGEPKAVSGNRDSVETPKVLLGERGHSRAADMAGDDHAGSERARSSSAPSLVFQQRDSRSPLGVDTGVNRAEHCV